MNSLSIFGLLALGIAMATTTACSSTEGTSTSSGSSGAAGGTSSTSGSPISLDGSYSGSFQGDDKGPLKMTITGTKLDAVATVGGTDYPAVGSVSAGGAVSLGIGVGNGVAVTFRGTFADGNGSGTWSSSVGTNGTWSVTK